MPERIELCEHCCYPMRPGEHCRVGQCITLDQHGRPQVGMVYCHEACWPGFRAACPERTVEVAELPIVPPAGAE